MKQFYSKYYLIFISIFFFSISISAQRGEKLWTKTIKESFSKTQKVIRKTEPTKATFYKLDINGLKTILQNAPKRNGFTGTSKVIVDFPNADGSLEAYRILEASVMDSILQEQHPNIRSYVGQSIENPATLIRFSLTPQGLHTMILSSNKGTQFMDPYTKNGNSYIVYAKQDLPSLKDNFICEVIDNISTNKINDFDFDEARNANDGKMRTFRLALACTIEYSQFHWEAAGLTVGDTEPVKKDAVLAAMVVTMTRVNGVYEKDLSITMTLIANNKDIIFIDSDSFNNSNAGVLIGQSQSVIDATIGDVNYDIGHTFSTGGGGLASLGQVCVTGSKARGITGSNAPVGDAYDIDFVAHELGHQFGANHTFNGDAGNCAGSTRVGSNAYEVGSGSTIMAYAGICSPQNVQNNSDAYFHQASLVEIWKNVTTGNSTCGTQTSNGNAAPTAMAGADYTIPISTPYKLTGSSTDTDGTGSHTFTWEEWDLGPSGIPTETTATGPLVRTFEGTTDPIRYIPRLTDVLSNGGVSTTWEKLVSIGRAINFQLTVRDNDVRGGQTDSDEMVITTEAAAGPFLVTSQTSSGISWSVGSTQTVTWNVASTDMAPVNAATVNIWLSTDAGATFTVPLASGVPNNGSYEISSVPNNIGPYCRVMVEGANNIFYNVNAVDFAVGFSVVTTCNQYNSSPAVPIDDNGGGFTQLDGIIVPQSITITDINIGVNITHPRIGDLLIAVLSPDGNQIDLINPGDCGSENDLILKFDDDGDPFDCANSGTNQIFQSLQESLSLLNGEESSGTWTLGVGDLSPGLTGTFNSWYVEVCETIITTLSIDDFNLEDSFLVFPNPNHGEFTVKLNSNSGNNVRISVYDIRGRRVFDNVYSSSSNFIEVVNLNNVQSGLYILKVNDGERSGTKKIIIN